MQAPDVKLGERFTSSALSGVLPLLIWAAHFFLSYASAEVACALRLQRFMLGGVSVPSVWLWIISVAAITALLVLAVSAIRHGRLVAGTGNTQSFVRIGAAVLALVGVLWSALPIALVDGSTFCRATR